VYVTYIVVCPNHDCNHVFNLVEPIMDQPPGVDGAWCIKTMCRTCDFKWWIFQSCEVSIPRKKRLSRHRKKCHCAADICSHHLDIEFDEDDAGKLSSFAMLEEEAVMPAANMVEVATTDYFLESSYGRQGSVSYFELEHNGEILGIN
jgi:hypothetical protein